MFQEFHIKQIPREQNIVADLLTNLEIHHGAVEWKTVILEYQDQLHIVKSSIEVNSSTITDDNWRHPIMEFLLHKTSPYDKK